MITIQPDTMTWYRNTVPEWVVDALLSEKKIEVKEAKKND